VKKGYELEIRITIKNINQFHKKLAELNAKAIYTYRFNDHIYIPKYTASNWNLNRKTLRIREHLSPEILARILFTENDSISGKKIQFKQSKYIGGKLELFRGQLGVAQAILHSLDFRHLFTIEKTNGKLFEILEPRKFNVAVEKITHLGYSAEIELWGDEITIIEKNFLEIISLLDIPPNNVSSNSLPFIIADHLGLNPANPSPYKSE